MPFADYGMCDLCLSENFDATKLSVLERLGYRTVAFERRIDESTFEPKKKKKGESPANSDCVPEPTSVPENSSNLNALRRLTIEFSDGNAVHKISQSENLKKYDLVAAVPLTAAAFQYACCTMDVDIISYRSDLSANFKINRKLYKQAVERGIHFELTYSSALKDSTHRKNLISRAQLYRSIGKSANLVISSGAHNEFQVRGPYDVVNLSLILGLSEQQSKNVLTHNMKKVLLKADNRRRGKTSIFILHKNKPNKRPMVVEDDSINVKKLKIED